MNIYQIKDNSSYPGMLNLHFVIRNNRGITTCTAHGYLHNWGICNDTILKWSKP